MQIRARRRINNSVAVGLVILGTAGCRTMSVQTRSLGSEQPQRVTTLPGVPFYAKTAFCVQTSTYLQPVYDVTLSLQTVGTTAAGKDTTYGPPRVSSRVISESGYRSPSFRTLRQIAAGAAPQQSETDVLSLWAALAAKDVAGGFPTDATDYFLAGNQFSTEVANDYTRVYYYNVRVPLTGSASGEINLDASGSLTKGVAAVEDQTLSTALGVLPIKEILTARLIPAPAATKSFLSLNFPSVPLAAHRGGVRVTLQVAQSTYRHTLTRKSEIDRATAPPCAPRAALTWGQDRGTAAYTREVVTTPAAPPAAKSDSAAAAK